jgi:phosphohistidine phosphatase SixA
MRRNVDFSMTLTMLLSLITLTHFGIAESKVYAKDRPETSQITTVFVLRHADRDREGNLTEEGKARAQDLVHVIGSVGIKGIYTTDFDRTRGTVQPLAVCLGIQPESYGRSLKTLAQEVMSRHRSYPSLIVGHDSTLKPTIEALIGREIEQNIGVQFDDLHIVTIDPSGYGTVVSIKYGKPLGRMKCKK